MKHKVIFGDSSILLGDIKNVALLATSPPYNIGREFEDFLESDAKYWELMSRVFSHTKEIMEPYGKVAINFPDRYANAKKFGYPIEELYAGYFDSIMTQADFDLWARIIWDKKKVFIDGATHLAAPSNKTGQMRVAPNWEYIFVWRKHSQPSELPKKLLDMSKEQRIEWTDSIWSIDSVTVNEREKGFKLAKFPEEIPYRLIKMYTQPGDLIVDPFAGVCTTTYVAEKLNRNSICIELNPAMEGYIRNYLEGIDVEYIHTPSERTDK